MNRRLWYAVVSTFCWLAMTATASAGPYDVTFQVPLNLTRLAMGVVRVRVTCVVNSTALPGGGAIGNVDFAVSGGQVITTGTVVVPVTSLDTSNGKTSANYRCVLQAFETTAGVSRIDVGSDFTNDPTSQFFLSPVPMPLSGTFTW